MSETLKSALFIHALTSLHPGSGTALGAVDLPVQRERHTQWPVIPGSSLKGILRDACRPQDGQSKDEWEAVFGPEQIRGESDAFAGALSLTDARILAFPVRSCRGLFAWVTCPAVLQRLRRDLTLVGHSNSFPSDPPKLSENQAGFGPELEVDGRLVLEEFDFAKDPQAAGNVPSVAQWLADHVIREDDIATRDRIKTHLVVLPDDSFTYFVQHATEVVSRIALDYATKTVKGTALFSEEFLPPETLFYALLFADKSRSRAKPMAAQEVQVDAGGGVAARSRGAKPMAAQEVQGYVKRFPPVLQMGANQTIGKGLCAVRLLNGKEPTP